MNIAYTTRNEKETEEFAKEVAKLLHAGSVVCLSGDLGVGKTTMTKGIARALGVTEHVTSPTFTVLQEYESGRLPLYHFDVYRVSDPEELFELGFDEYIHGRGVTIIEWSDLIQDMLPEERIEVTMEKSEFPGADENERIIYLNVRTLYRNDRSSGVRSHN